MSQSAVYSEAQARHANLTLERLGLSSWEEVDVKALQQKVGAKPVDGWFGPKSIATWKAWAKENDPNPVHKKIDAVHSTLEGTIIINGNHYTTPPGVVAVNFLAANGIPAELDDTNERKHDVFQFVLHRGAETAGVRDKYNYAVATERILDGNGYSTTFSMDIDGVIYQHFDPGKRRGRHCSSHNVQSDSLDIGGPFSSKTKPQPGQEPLTFKAAIGREGDGKPPMTRTYGTVKCWDLTPAQKKALIAFIPWYCEIRGIPLTACEDMRTFRLSGHLGTKDPVTHVKGLLAHAQVSDPGRRVDGFLALIVLRAADTKIRWRSGEDFFKT